MVERMRWSKNVITSVNERQEERMMYNWLKRCSYDAMNSVRSVKVLAILEMPRLTACCVGVSAPFFARILANCCTSIEFAACHLANAI